MGLRPNTCHAMTVLICVYLCDFTLIRDDSMANEKENFGAAPSLRVSYRRNSRRMVTIIESYSVEGASIEMSEKLTREREVDEGKGKLTLLNRRIEQ